MAKGTKKRSKSVETLTHGEAARRNIPTAEFHPVMAEEDKAPIRVAYERRNRDLDPQLVWRGKDEQDAADLVVQAPPLYIQEKVHPKVLIDDLLRQTKERREEEAPTAPDLFADFNGLPDGAATTEFYRHDANWSNRMILGDSLQVMASLAEREGLRGKVQCIYIDPPYGIKFNSNFQWSTTSRDVKDGKAEHITREPEQVKAFRDTWRDGIHSYLTYLRDRLIAARELLTESGSVFVQIGDENVHRVRAVMDEVFGEANFIDQIVFQTSSGRVSDGLDGVYDAMLWYAKQKELAKFRKLKKARSERQRDTAYNYLQFDDGSFRVMSASERSELSSIPEGARRFRPGQTQSQSGGESSRFTLEFEGKIFSPPPTGGWRTSVNGFLRAAQSARLMARGRSVAYRLCDSDNPMIQMTNVWTDTVFVAFGSDKFVLACKHWSRASAGVLHPRVLRGRVLSASQLRVRPDCVRSDRFLSGSTVEAVHWCSRSFRVAKGCAVRRSRREGRLRSADPHAWPSLLPGPMVSERRSGAGNVVIVRAMASRTASAP